MKGPKANSIESVTPPRCNIVTLRAKLKYRFAALCAFFANHKIEATVQPVNTAPIKSRLVRLISKIVELKSTHYINPHSNVVRS